jgi:uncharacterized protein YxeA
MKKILALVLALLLLAMGTTAFAVDLEANGEEGVVGQFYDGVGVDTPTTTDKNINIKLLKRWKRLKNLELVLQLIIL